MKRSMRNHIITTLRLDEDWLEASAQLCPGACMKRADRGRGGTLISLRYVDWGRNTRGQSVRLADGLATSHTQCLLTKVLLHCGR